MYVVQFKFLGIFLKATKKAANILHVDIDCNKMQLKLNV